MTELSPYEGPKKSLLFTTQLVYILHGLSIVIGLMTGGTILSAFLFGWPSIAAVVLKSHFSWQIRTFWYGMVWTVLVALAGFFLTVIVVGPIIWFVGFIVLGIWVAYRIAIGWVRLRQYRPIYSD